MKKKSQNPHQESVGSWAKRLYFATRALMDTVLRPYDLGSTQWYVLHQLANEGPTRQRDLVRMLHIERATLSGVVLTLVRKGLIEQLPEVEDQRQRMLRITAAGKRLWKRLPDPIALILSVAFDGVDQAELVTTRRVLQDATERLSRHSSERNPSWLS